MAILQSQQIAFLSIQGIDGTDTVTIEVPNLDNDISS